MASDRNFSYLLIIYFIPAVPLVSAGARPSNFIQNDCRFSKREIIPPTALIIEDTQRATFAWDKSGFYVYD